ncbi:hypothetical protein HDG38_002440 [Paraburkholderia sp. WSM4177]|nr:hypothetical protein [Paraburkholderia sp. WSM4177]MBB5485057.1 hypothetical protein [Paraburkholderia sp. WSM4180]
MSHRSASILSPKTRHGTVQASRPHVFDAVFYRGQAGVNAVQESRGIRYVNRGIRVAMKGDEWPLWEKGRVLLPVPAFRAYVPLFFAASAKADCAHIEPEDRRARCEIVCVVRAAVQHHKQWQRLAGGLRWHIKPILAATGRIRMRKGAENVSSPPRPCSVPVFCARWIPLSWQTQKPRARAPCPAEQVRSLP